MSNSTVLKYVDAGVEKTIADFANYLRVGVSDISNRLKVIELKLSEKRNSFFLQLIFNPWAFSERPPTVEIMNITCETSSGDYFEIAELNALEGRFKLVFGDACRDEWRSNLNLVAFFNNWILPALEEVKSSITYRNLRTSPGTWDLHFPTGISVHLDRLEHIATKKKWNLLTESESLVHLKNIEKQKEAERIKFEAEIEKFKLAVEKSESLEELDKVIDAYGGEEAVDANLPDFVSRIGTIRDSLTEPEPQPLNFDDPAFTLDNNGAQNTRKKSTMRRY